MVLKSTMLSAKFLFIILLIFSISNCLDSICHSKCYCMKSSKLLQCSNMGEDDFKTFKSCITWVREVVLTSSCVDSDQISATFPNVERVILHSCNIYICYIPGCPIDDVAIDIDHSTQTPMQGEVKHEKTVSDVKFELKMENFETSLSLFQLQMTDFSSTTDQYKLIEYAFFSLGSITFTLFLVLIGYCTYRCYNSCTMVQI